MRLKWKRREWVANIADPTQVVMWELHVRSARVKLIASWGVEAIIGVGKHTWRTYDARWAKKLFDRLESREQERLAELY